MNPLPLPSRKAILEEASRRHLLRFMRHCWWMPGQLIEGRHTVAIADRLTQAAEDFEQGISTFLIIALPFRHGKSDMVSRAFPAWFLGRCRHLQPDVILSGYGAKLVEGFSRKVKGIIRSDSYQGVFPGVEIAEGRDALDKWAIEGSAGEVTVAGLGGAITGVGGHLIDIDDYCKSREEAESETYRERMWESFKDDLMTRRAPTSIVIVCATRWHIDDVIGRIKKEIQVNPDFPRFEELVFPAQSDEYRSEDNRDGYLFPERFSPAWYTSQRATLGAYSAAALLDCEPRLRGGGMFMVDNIVLHDSLDEFPDIPYARFWDLASTVKERVKDDPDRTAGALMGVRKVGLVDEIWLKDLVVMQEEAPRRDARIIATTEKDGAAVRVGVEGVAGYKDTYTTLKNILRGSRSVSKADVSGDKVVRSAPMEPIFEAGNFHMLRAEWNQYFYADFGPFPSGKHDDVVDSVSGGYELLRGSGVAAVGGYDPF